MTEPEPNRVCGSEDEDLKLPPPDTVLVPVPSPFDLDPIIIDLGNSDDMDDSKPAAIRSVQPVIQEHEPVPTAKLFPPELLVPSDPGICIPDVLFPDSQQLHHPYSHPAVIQDDDDDEDDDNWSRQVETDEAMVSLLHEDSSSRFVESVVEHDLVLAMQPSSSAMADDEDDDVDVDDQSSSGASMGSNLTDPAGGAAAGMSEPSASHHHHHHRRRHHHHQRRHHHRLPPPPPSQPEVTLKQKLVLRERERRIETERARLKRQFAMANNAAAADADVMLRDNDDYNNNDDGVDNNNYNWMGEAGTAAITTALGSAAAVSGSDGLFVTTAGRDHHRPRRHHHHHPDAMGGMVGTALLHSESGSASETLGEESLIAHADEESTSNEANLGFNMERFLRNCNPQLETMAEANAAGDNAATGSSVVMERFLNNPIVVVGTGSGEPPSLMDVGGGGVIDGDVLPHRSVSFDMDSNHHRHHDHHRLSSAESNGAAVLLSDSIVSSFRQGRDARDDANASMDANTSVQVEMGDDADHDVDDDDDVDDDNGVHDMVAPLHHDPLLLVDAPESTAGDDSIITPVPDEPRVLRLTEADMQEMAAIEHASIGNAPPSEREEEMLSEIGELADFGSSALHHHHLPNTNNSLDTPTTAMESSSQLSNQILALHAPFDSDHILSNHPTSVGEDIVDNDDVVVVHVSIGDGDDDSHRRQEQQQHLTLQFPSLESDETGMMDLGEEDGQMIGLMTPSDWPPPGGLNVAPTIQALSAAGSNLPHLDLVNYGSMLTEPEDSTSGALLYHTSDDAHHHEVHSRAATSRSPNLRTRGGMDHLDLNDSENEPLLGDVPPEIITHRTQEQHHHPVPSTTMEAFALGQPGDSVDQRLPASIDTFPIVTSSNATKTLTTIGDDWIHRSWLEFHSVSLRATVDSIFHEVRCLEQEEKVEIHNESMQYVTGSMLARVFPERLIALTATLIVETPVLLMIAGGSDALCELIGRTRYHLLIGFLPLTSAISGNVGLQASTLTTRAICHSHLTPNSYWHWLVKEIGAAALLGAGMGLLLGIMAFFASGMDLSFSITILIAQFVSVVTAGCTGTVAPLLFTFVFGRHAGKWGGLLQTAIQDVVGGLVMVVLSYHVLKWLGPGPIDPSEVCKTSPGI